ncbi:MAG: DUF393 domain-containing protein [Gemmatimonadaceae bacterium]|nr:DUF393 domain-containing protein [Gemmatimonadaceae bacterium]
MSGASGDAAAEPPVLLYDGACGLCAASVQFVLRHESPSRPSSLRFAPLQGAFGEVVRARHPDIRLIDSVVWYEPLANGASRVRVRSEAALALLTQLGGKWRTLAVLVRLVPRPLRDALYDAIARRRTRLVAPACLRPPEHACHRFLD